MIAYLNLEIRIEGAHSLKDKRQVVRWLLQRVVVWAPAASHEVRVQLHWTGGVVTEHQLK